MLLIERVRFRHIFFIPSVIAGFIAAEKQQGNAAWIEGIQDTNGFPTMLHPQLAHKRKAKGDNRFTVPLWKRRAELLQKINIPINTVLL